MASLQVRELPELLYCKLQQQAKKDHRSLAQEAVSVIEKGLGMAHNGKERRKALLRKLDNLNLRIYGKNVKSPARLIREDRQR